LKLSCDKLLSNFAFRLNLRRYSKANATAAKKTGGAAGAGAGVVTIDAGALMAPSTTALSPYLKFGCVSMRTFYHELHTVGRCRLTVSKAVLKAPMVSALETGISHIISCFQR